MGDDGSMPALHIPGHEHPRPKEVSLEEIRSLMGDCQLCPLGQTRTNLVFGVGNPSARVMFIGEGPGKNEDLQGVPFVGAAGKRLDSLLSLANLTRDEVYIANVVKCRPPSNRNPKPEEIAACSPFLREQIRSVWPDVLICLGNFASQFVLQTEKGVMSLRGKLYQKGHFIVCPTFHPAATIYHSDWEPLLESDLTMVGAWLAANPAGPGKE
jgi:uracil-DNA glycosylase family 4